MLPKLSAEPANVPASESASPAKETPFLAKKIWLPRFVYDALPYFYLTAGFAAFFATLYISEWFWVVPYYILFSGVCLHLGLTIRARRNAGERSTDSNDARSR